MSKKLKTRLILLVVLAIWGNIGYRLFKNYQVEKELDETQQVYNDPNFSPANFQKDSFDLQLPDTDPFLKTKIKSNYKPINETPVHTTNNNHHRKTQKEKKVVEQKNWPKIKYLGFVKNHESSDALCLLQINGNMLKVSEGDEEIGVLVTGVFRDSIHLVFSGEEKTFRKG